MLGLTCSALDLDEASLRVVKTIVSNGWRIEQSGPKTQKGRRSIALDPATIECPPRHLIRWRDVGE